MFICSVEVNFSDVPVMEVGEAWIRDYSPYIKLGWFSCETSRQEAAGALWNLSFDDRNREAIAAARGVEALVSYDGFAGIS